MNLFISWCAAAVEPIAYILFLFVAFVILPALVDAVKKTVLRILRRNKKQQLADWRPQYYILLLASRRRVKHENRFN